MSANSSAASDLAGHPHVRRPRSVVDLAFVHAVRELGLTARREHLGLRDPLVPGRAPVETFKVLVDPSQFRVGPGGDLIEMPETETLQAWPRVSAPLL